MIELKANGNEINSIFQLIGIKENDIPKSIAWTWANCPSFLMMTIKEILNIVIDPKKVRIKYQEFEKDKGITDLELTDEVNFYILIEAKRGWLLPNADQIMLYSDRRTMCESKANFKAIVSMSECSKIYAQANLPFNEINGIPILHLSWARIYEIVNISRNSSSAIQRHLLKELLQYLERIMTMQEKSSNWVYVVSLSTSKPVNCNLTWIEIVQNNQIYFHPMGRGKNGWPKEPPNYIAFRYGGQLQAIHHIKEYVVTRNLHEKIIEMPNIEADVEYFVYKLGPAIRPSKIVKTGNIYASGRKWAMIDALLTADTIAEACDISKARNRIL